MHTLLAEGYRVETSDGGALRVEGRAGLEASGPYRAGQLEIQYLAGQRCGQAAPVAPGQICSDACAGRGGDARNQGPPSSPAGVGGTRSKPRADPA